MKTCAMCHTELPKSEFNKAANHLDGLASWCRSCNRAYLKGYNEGRARDRTLEKAVRAYRRHYDINFIVGEMFYAHIGRSRKHAHKVVSYTQAQLLEFVLGHAEAYEIHDAWVQSGFVKSLKLSVDRKDATKGYSLDNIQIMTWGENNFKGRKEGRPVTKSVLQFTKDGCFVREWESAVSASRYHAPKIKNHSKSKIYDNLAGRSKTFHGYKFKYKEEATL